MNRPGSPPIHYQVGGEFALDQVIDLYHASTLGERRPVGDRACMAQMIEHADLIVTAWQNGELVGISRTLTDFCYVAYLADLAVRATHQRQGIGVRLVAETRSQLGPQARIVLLAAPAAREYYPRIGFQSHDSCWILGPEDRLGSNG